MSGPLGAVNGLSAETRDDLRIALDGYDAAAITAIEAAIDRYHRMKAATEADNRAAETLRRRLKRVRNVFRSITLEIDSLERDPMFANGLRHNPDGLRHDSAEAIRLMMVRGVALIDDDLRLLRVAPGRKPAPRIQLTAGIARALRAAGVPLKKSRTSVAGRVFVLVYEAVGLPSTDLFDAVEQGVTLATKGVRITRKTRRDIPTT